MLFRTNEGKWMSTFFGSDEKAAFKEKAGLLPIEFDSSGKFRPLLQTTSSTVSGK
jgi:hypothetical protein